MGNKTEDDGPQDDFPRLLKDHGETENGGKPKVSLNMHIYIMSAFAIA